MTDHSGDGAASAAQLALRAVADGNADETELNTLAGAEILIPTPADAVDTEDHAPRTVSLPVYEQQDGTGLVPVFTSHARMRQALPQVTEHRRMRLGALAHGWPSEELALVIDAGTSEELALTAQGVHELLDRGTG